jgi:hypothetical protein
MTYACPALEFEADTYRMKLQRLQNKVLGTTGKIPWRALTHDLQYVHDFIINYAGSKYK